ncbi:glutamine-hydrolyzing GMP synthase [Neoehrlichia mikurensis]|uniref:GMP synthase [glutamine-hydrolyzing] n=1 Tax=Neoehrlichia mikurensis TaxID=89586 RepID=A0A9Q9BZU9_9RICK|nr:glutamine-hydrolyzing GMP synthase [Neoehrlichia mikurensis]QXK92269.1 glutamine-hydrolyzing GMP synthase [Neoehrlichia mikurensis]QXK92723.1 glutamine-hydrolyzing GMP synthase [Neoehrlichia mikurensis]QXK93962.1 glutamine-hydrolyzing GMP synthase [Neoehrlichia mikurensis]UTO55873.1 glutamine-hydrolyzing GMP synthase [Neoehrlichia mikurensis]UTO56789.1 glutamine-hydrolyzing GMP synthase [Neoehrlichia mikurensis]
MSKVAIIDFGSQVTQLIARRIREFNVYSEVFCYDDYCNVNIKNFNAFILSGGPGSICNLSEIPKIVLDILALNEKTCVPILGICYGVQILGLCFNSLLVSDCKEFGKTRIQVVRESMITKEVWNLNDKVDVWMSHSDSLSTIPQGFEVIAYSVPDNVIAMISNEERKIYGMQFHPEVTHTFHGMKLFDNFLKIAQCTRNWTIASFLEKQKNAIKNNVGDKKVIAAISGGVDSSVAAVLLHRAIKNQLHCVFIDNGLLRKDESSKVRSIFTNILDIPICFLDKSELFLSRLSGITDPEKKRKIIGNTFIEVFESYAKEIGDVDFLMQGTIYPDVIESGTAKSAKIKSHHNVGGLPEKMNLLLVEPLKYLFKDEVRLLGRELGISEEVLMRHPFPGPGLSIRIIGEVTCEKVHILQNIDDIYVNLLKEYELYDSIWQAFAVLLPLKTVGVMGDSRTYSYACALRAVTSDDGMSANSFPFDEGDSNKLKFCNFLQKVSNTIINNVKEVNRVMYDITSKPPSTIEWE